jgi:cell volume regulation protein A
VADSALALGYAYDELPMPRRTRIVAVFRDGTVMDRANLARLAASDYVLTLAPPEQLSSLDRLFASRPIEFGRHSSDIFGEFVLDGQVLVGGVAAFYGFAIEPEEQTLRLGEFIARRLRHRVVVGDRLRCEQVEFVVQSMADNKVIAVGIELDPESSLRQRFAALRWFDRAIIGRWRR